MQRVSRIPFLIDTDVGSDVDDAYALAVAALNTEIRIAAISTVSGNSDRSAAIARRILSLAERADVPVFSGHSAPRSPSCSFVWFGNEGDGILPAEHTFTGATAERSLAKLRDLLIRESSIEVIAIGPLTNIAELVTACPDVTARIARLTIMGGMTEEGATPLPSCFDYNLWADPISTAQVFGSGVPIRLVPIELTMRAILSVTDLEQLAATDHPLCGALGKATRDWTPILHLIFQGFGLRLNGDVAAFLHDVIALYSACHPEYCRFADRYVVPRVSTDKVLLEPVAQHDHGSVNVEYMTHLNWSGLKEHFMNTLRSLHGRAVAPGVSDIAGGDVLGYPSTMIVSPAPIQPPPPPGLHRIDDLSPFAI